MSMFGGDSWNIPPYGGEPVNVDELQRSWEDRHPQGPTAEEAGLTLENIKQSPGTFGLGTQELQGPPEPTLDQYMQGYMPPTPQGPPAPMLDAQGYPQSYAPTGPAGVPVDVGEWQGPVQPEMQGPSLGLGAQPQPQMPVTQDRFGNVALGNVAPPGFQGMLPGGQQIPQSGWRNTLFHLGGALEALGGKGAPMYQAALDRQQQQQRLALHQYELQQRDQIRRDAIGERLMNHYGNALKLMEDVPDEQRAQAGEMLARQADQISPRGGDLIRTITAGGQVGRDVSHQLETTSPEFIHHVKDMRPSEQKKYLYSPEGRAEIKAEQSRYADELFSQFAQVPAVKAFAAQIKADADVGHPMGEMEAKRLFRLEIAKPEYGVPEPLQRSLDTWLGTKAGQDRMASLGVELDEVSRRREDRSVIDQSQAKRDTARREFMREAHADAEQERWDRLKARFEHTDEQNMRYRIPADIREAWHQNKELSDEQKSRLKASLKDNVNDLKLHADERANTKMQENLVKTLDDQARITASYFNKEGGSNIDYNIYANELASSSHAHPGLSDESLQRLLEKATRVRQYGKPGAGPGPTRTIEPTPGQAEIEHGQQVWRQQFGGAPAPTAPAAPRQRPAAPARPAEPSGAQLPPVPKAAPQAALPPPKTPPTPAQLKAYNAARASGLDQAAARRKAGIK